MAKQKVTRPPKTHFVVSRITWRVAGYDRTYVRLAGDTRVAAFADFDSAEADRVSREAAARKLVNPFRCGASWSDRTSFPEPIFRDFLADVSIKLPKIVPIPTTDSKGNP